MNRDKQIEEMAKDIACKIAWDDDEIPTVDCLETAKRLYNAGYRKSTDVAEEIFAEIERQLNDFNGSWADTVINTQYLIAELKKKYTKEITEEE